MNGLNPENRASQSTEVPQELIDISNTTAAEYAEFVVAHHPSWMMNNGNFHSPIIDAVVAGFRSFVSSRSAEEIEEAKEVFIGYGREQAQKYSAEGYSTNDHLTWITKLRRMAGIHVVDRDSERTYMTDDSGNFLYSSEQFWQDIYNVTISEQCSKQAVALYVLGPNIENKDPAILSDVVDRLQEEEITDVLSLAPNRGDGTKGVRMAYDKFNSLVNEAASAGWQNAIAVQAMLAKIPNKRDMPQHSMLNLLGNHVTDVLNANNAQPEEGVQLDKLNLYEISHMSEAINRCLYLMFDLGTDPPGHDSLNYRLTGQILYKLGVGAEKAIRD